MKNEKSLVKFKPDTLDDVRDNDLVQVARKLLASVIKASSAMNIDVITDKDNLQTMKLVLGYLNATNKVVTTKMQIFKMVGLDKKLRAVKKVRNG